MSFLRSSAHQKVYAKLSTKAGPARMDNKMEKYNAAESSMSQYSHGNSLSVEDGWGFYIKHAWGSSCHQVHHIHLHCFFMTKQFTDIFTKPLQYATFHHFCSAMVHLKTFAHACPDMLHTPGHKSVLGNESVMTNSRWTRELDGSGGRKQMAEQMAKASVEMKNEPSAPHYFKSI